MIAEYGGMVTSTAAGLVEYFTVSYSSIKSMQLFAAAVIVTLLFIVFKR